MGANHELVPLVDAGMSGEATPGTQAAAEPIPYLPKLDNFAEDETIRDRIKNELYPIITQTRMDRQPLEDEWSQIRRMEMMLHDGGRKYNGRSNAYLPVYLRILATLVSNLSRGLFPSDEYMDVSDESQLDQTNAEKTKALLKYQFEQVAKLRTVIKPFLRQFENFGTSVLKHRYKAAKVYQGRRAPKINDVRASPRFLSASGYDGLSVTTRSIFDVHVYPMTVDSADEAQVIFEDIQVPKSYVAAMGRSKRWKNTDLVMKSGGDPGATARDTTAEEVGGVTNSLASGGNDMADMVTLTEVWCYLVLGKSAYVDGEDTLCPIPTRVVMHDDTILEVTRNPSFEQRAPYEIISQNRTPGFLYGYGAGKAVKGLQYLANDFANQVNDNGAFGMNPVGLINPGMIAAPLRALSPGVLWHVTDVDKAVKFDRPPVEQLQYGMMLLNTMVGMAQDGGGAPPILQGLNSGKRTTATGMQILQKNSQGPLQDVVEDIEQEAMVPLMLATWFLAQQYMPEEVFFAVTNGMQKVTQDELSIRPRMRWLASSQAANQQMRAQQLLQLMQGIGPIVPILMQQGYIVDFAPLIKRIYSDGFGLRGFDQFIKKAQAVPGAMPGQPVPAEAMGGVQQEQGDRVRSALEQVAGAGVEMVPGEGGDFMDVRAQADQMAAEMGE